MGVLRCWLDASEFSLLFAHSFSSVGCHHPVATLLLLAPGAVGSGGGSSWNTSDATALTEWPHYDRSFLFRKMIPGLLGQEEVEVTGLQCLQTPTVGAVRQKNLP